jgi:hypothetical protein
MLFLDFMLTDKQTILAGRDCRPQQQVASPLDGARSRRSMRPSSLRTATNGNASYQRSHRE